MVVLKRAQITICESDQCIMNMLNFSTLSMGHVGVCCPFLLIIITTVILNPLAPRPAAELSLGNPMQREVTTTLKVNNKHQTKVSTYFVFFPVCKYIVLVYPVGFD